MQFNRGYKEVQDKVRKGSKYIMSCFNCAYYYKEFGDNEEMCQNSAVLKYDMVITPTSIYCTQWKPYERKEENTMFKSGGKKLERKSLKVKKTGK